MTVRVMKTTGCTAMKCVSIVAATLLATNALAQVIDEPASSNIAAATGEPEPLLPEKCELLEVVNGAKLWKGDCISRPAAEEPIVRKKKREKRFQKAPRLSALKLDSREIEMAIHQL
jgi:hypothetical protein